MMSEYIVFVKITSITSPRFLIHHYLLCCKNKCSANLLLAKSASTPLSCKNVLSVIMRGFKGVGGWRCIGVFRCRPALAPIKQRVLGNVQAALSLPLVATAGLSFTALGSGVHSAPLFPSRAIHSVHHFIYK